jgi:hypothetical protein
MPVGDAFAGPWLCTIAWEFVLNDVVPVGDVAVVDRALFAFAFAIPVGDAFIGPWLCMAAPAPMGGPP